MHVHALTFWVLPSSLLTLLARIGIKVQVVTGPLALPLRGLCVQGIVSPSSCLCPLLVNRQELLELGVFLQLVAPQREEGNTGQDDSVSSILLTPGGSEHPPSSFPLGPARSALGGLSGRFTGQEA